MLNYIIGKLSILREQSTFLHALHGLSVPSDRLDRFSEAVCRVQEEISTGLWIEDNDRVTIIGRVFCRLWRWMGVERMKARLPWHSYVEVTGYFV